MNDISYIGLIRIIVIFITMEYQIEESQLARVIDKYLTFQFDGLKHINDGKHREVWVGPERKPVIIILSDTEVFEAYILEDVYRSTYNIFSLNGLTDIQKYLIKWFKDHMNIEVEEVSTFDNEGVDYVY